MATLENRSDVEDERRAARSRDTACRGGPSGSQLNPGLRHFQPTNDLTRREGRHGDDDGGLTRGPARQDLSTPAFAPGEAGGDREEGHIVNEDDHGTPRQDRRGVCRSKEHMNARSPQGSRKTGLLPESSPGAVGDVPDKAGKC
jgi:hypothetical protein